MHIHSNCVIAVGVGLLLTACGDTAENKFPGAQPKDKDDAGDPIIRLGEGGIGTGGDGSSGPTLPSNFVATEFGGYALGAPITGDGDSGTIETGLNTSDAGAGNGCSLIAGVVRDFKMSTVTGGDPDFESFAGQGITPNLVAMALGSDRKPVYASVCEMGVTKSPACPYGQMTTTKANFDEWYRFTKDVNKPYLVYFEFAPNGSVYTFQSKFFFPVDGAGWMDTAKGDDGKSHNFAFTTELHTRFQYNGGESFTFTGDDDVWVFINGQLAVDVGGLHSAEQKSVDLDKSAAALGLVKGQQYALELFHAERHTSASTFRVDTNLAFTDCGSVVPDVPN